MSSRRGLTLRARWALWCAALVTLAGTVAVLTALSITSWLLRRRNDAAMRPIRPAGGAAVGGPLRDPMQLGGQVADSVIRDVRVIGLVTVAALALLALVVAWFVAGRMVKPIKAVTRAAADVSGARLGARIDYDGPNDELHELADTFDAMLGRLDVAFAAQRAFVADASHELRTPLSVMRAEIDVALDDPNADADSLREAMIVTSAALDRSTLLIQSLLALSRSETLVNVADHDLAASVERSLAVHPTDQRTIERQLSPGVTRGDPVLLDRLVDNVIDNAVRYSPPTGTIAVRTATDGDVVTVSVDNDGDSLDADEIAANFQRFVRRSRSNSSDLRHPGAGVGLAVVATIVRTHGGQIAAVPRPAGGLSITITLPAWRPTPSA